MALTLDQATDIAFASRTAMPEAGVVDAELTPTFEPPYTAVIFSSLRTEGDQGYAAVAARMEELAAQQPGYLGVESARDPKTGLGITISYWHDHASAAAWKKVTEHERAQANGKRLWYRNYVVRVATVDRDYRGNDAATVSGGAD